MKLIVSDNKCLTLVFTFQKSPSLQRANVLLPIFPYLYCLTPLIQLFSQSINELKAFGVKSFFLHIQHSLFN